MDERQFAYTEVRIFIGSNNLITKCLRFPLDYQSRMNQNFGVILPPVS